MNPTEWRLVLAYIDELEADLARTRFFAWSLAAISFATILAISALR